MRLAAWMCTRNGPSGRGANKLQLVLMLSRRATTPSAFVRDSSTTAMPVARESRRRCRRESIGMWNCASPEGKAGARDWFEGYRQGARVARAGGYRETAVVASSTGLAVHSDQASYAGQGMSAQGYPADLSAPAGTQPPLEALPVPTTPSPESGSQPPASSVVPPALLPRLTRPKTENIPDGATINRKDAHVATTSYTTTTGIRAKTPIAKPIAANNSSQQSLQQSPTKVTNRNASVRQACNCDEASDNGLPQMPKNRGEIANASEDCIAAPTKLAVKVAPDSHGDTRSAESEGRGSDVAAPAVIEHTTLVFKQ